MSSSVLDWVNISGVANLASRVGGGVGWSQGLRPWAKCFDPPSGVGEMGLGFCQGLVAWLDDSTAFGGGFGGWLDWVGFVGGCDPASRVGCGVRACPRVCDPGLNAATRLRGSGGLGWGCPTGFWPGLDASTCL